MGSAREGSIARTWVSAEVRKALRNVAPAATSPSWAGPFVDKAPPSCALTPNDHDPGVSTKSGVGKVPPELKCARSRAERGSDSHDLARSKGRRDDLVAVQAVGKEGHTFT